MDDLTQKRSLYPRVSEIIGKQNADALRGISLEVLANAAFRGTKIHSYCTSWARSLWIDEIEPEYQPYYDAFVQWAEEHVEEVIHSSVRLYDDELRFTGEFDMIVKMKESKEMVLIDIKTSASTSKAWPLQLAAYGHLCNQNDYHFDRIMNVHLKKTKTAVFDENEGEKVLVSPPQVRVCIKDHGDPKPYWEIFSSALKCYDYFDRKEVKNV